MNQFQQSVARWLHRCFDQVHGMLTYQERNSRFLEEALEVVQANGMTEEEARKILAYVYDRPSGSIRQEVGGAVITLAALCHARGISMEECATLELEDCWARIQEIRTKQIAKRDKGVSGP